jgi:hypothetical protein
MWGVRGGVILMAIEIMVTVILVWVIFKKGDEQ